VEIRVELLADRIDFLEAGFFKGGRQLLERQVGARFQALYAGIVRGECGLQAVLDGEQLAGEALDGEFRSLGDVFLRAAADIFSLRLGSEPGIVMFLGLQLGLADHLFEAGGAVEHLILGGGRDGFGRGARCRVFFKFLHG